MTSHQHLSLLNADFHIGITEHKILEDEPIVKNIDLPGYHTFHYQPTETLHGGTGFYVMDSLVFIERKEISFNSTGDLESCFIELVIPNKKNFIAGCIYHHPSSSISVQHFYSDYIEPMLKKVSAENKLCDFNIDLLEVEKMMLIISTITCLPISSHLLYYNQPDQLLKLL